MSVLQTDLLARLLELRQDADSRGEPQPTDAAYTAIHEIAMRAEGMGLPYCLYPTDDGGMVLTLYDSTEAESLAVTAEADGDVTATYTSPAIRWRDISAEDIGSTLLALRGP